MRKQYTLPTAEITVFAPTESIAATGWKQGGVSSENRWWIPANGFNYWSADNIPSATNAFWYDFGTSEIDPESKGSSN